MRPAMESVVAAAILRQLGRTLGICIHQVYRPNPGENKDVWTITATSDGGEAWTAWHEDCYKAACGPVELVKFRVLGG
jgi:hypothetical protein